MAQGLKQMEPRMISSHRAGDELTGKAIDPLNGSEEAGPLSCGNGWAGMGCSGVKAPNLCSSDRSTPRALFVTPIVRRHISAGMHFYKRLIQKVLLLISAPSCVASF